MQIDLTLRYQCRADCVHFRFNRRGKLLTGVCLKKKIKIKKRSLQLPRSSRLHLFKHLFLYKQQRSWRVFSNVSNLKGTTLLLVWEAESKNLWHFSSVDDNPPDKKKWLLLWIFYFFFYFLSTVSALYLSLRFLPPNPFPWKWMTFHFWCSMH